MSDRVGYWADMENPYVTYDDNYIESVWWAIKTIAEKGLLYKGHKIVPYCPRCGTALSSHEVAQGYKNVKESYYAVTDGIMTINFAFFENNAATKHEKKHKFFTCACLVRVMG